METTLRLYIKHTFNKNVAETSTVEELLAFIVNFSYSEGFEEGYKEGVESQKNT
jgi:hypothetical protein